MTISTPAMITVACTLFGILAIARSKMFNCDGSTEYFELGSRVEVLCHNETALFAVLWSREGSSEPFLRLDEGAKTETAGYEITDVGAMVITNLQVEHEGLYQVTTVDLSTSTVEGTIRIYARVMLKEEPRVEQCHTSSSGSCTHLSESQRATALVCIAEGSRPAADLTWGSLRGSSPVFSTNTSVNGSLFTAYATLQYNAEGFAQQLFTCSISEIPVEHTIQKSVYLEGQMLIDGQETKKNVTAGKYLDLECFPDSGSESLRRWRYTLPDGTVEVLRNSYPENSSGPCYSRKSCAVSGDGTLRVTGMTYKDEGVYECVFTNSSFDSNASTDVSVVVAPTPLQTVISGCDNPNGCNLTVANDGMLGCSVIGSRPAVKLSVVLRESDQHAVFLYDQLYSTTDIDPDSGTFNSILEVQYDIKECSGPVQLSCIATQDINGVSIQSSVVNLITAKCDGGGRPGLIAFLVLLFFLITLFTLVFIKRKYVRRKLNPYLPVSMRREAKPVRYSPEEAEPLKPMESFDKELFGEFDPIYKKIVKDKDPDDFRSIVSFCSTNEIEVPIQFLTSYLSSRDKKENKNIVIVLRFVVNNQPDDWMVLYQEMFYKLLTDKQPLSSQSPPQDGHDEAGKSSTTRSPPDGSDTGDQVISNEDCIALFKDVIIRHIERGIDVQKLVEIIDRCISKKIVDLNEIGREIKNAVLQQSIDSSTDFLTALGRNKLFDQREEDLLKLLNDIFGEDMQQAVSQYIDLLLKLVVAKKISATNFLTLVGKAFQKRKIEISRYVEVTGICLDKNILSFDLVMNELKSFVDKRFCSKDELTNSMLLYYMNGHMEEAALVKEVCSHLRSTTNKFVFPHFLQSVFNGLRKEGAETEKLVQLFTKIRLKFITIKSAYQVITEVKSGDTWKVDLTSASVQLILISNNLKLIDGNTCIEMIENTKMTPPELQEILKHFVDHDVLSTEVLTQLSTLALEKRMITDDFYVKILVELKDKNKINRQRYTEYLMAALVEKLISEVCLERTIIPQISNREWDKREWVVFVGGLARDEKIAEGLRIRLFEAIFKTFKLSKKDVKKQLMSKLEMSKEDVDNMLSKVDIPKLPKYMQSRPKTKIPKDNGEDTID